MEFTEEELHYIAMNFIGEELQKMGFEFLAVNSKLKKHPQFVTYKKNQKNIFVLVQASLPPDDYTRLPAIASKVISHAREQDARVWFAGVGITHADDLSRKPVKGEAYKLLFNGFNFLS
ncbi:Na(+)-translocating NADH-quinone reductase subunit F [Ornithobacterium rhinotracheale]|uniref:Na(+)-translocating NADH-quinone reductase subunit F n=1 Tax=Ornithobacterium rhinotracheale TaxID=28251 RepID=A0A410JSB1_ORNRH|nr:Na(+)-translocating NADH-quinone reductase subunit F [Ornithobacterium rhinotracheale]QAR30971.1 Na(+)-translocating NADH-quinone reductase subunit F [Ornithobacterium rhinotracheale]